ncbi:MAG: hypothetical protein M3P27_01995 [Acidobacteriota bacterium]|nr:hypothetical protein [Acidobacteriota bacterium]
MIRRIVVAALLLTALSPVAVADKKIKLDPTCKRDQSIMAFQKTIKANGGAIDTIHLKNGLIVLVTARSAKAAKAIQAAAADYRTQEDKAAGEKGNSLDPHCQTLLRLMQQGTVTAETHNIAEGVMLVYLTADPGTVVTIQDDCCKWCTCPSSNWRCSGCC